MKKIYIALWIVFVAFSGLIAQQVPVYNLYTVNPNLYNPAYSGGRDFGSAYLLHRNQWTDMPGAPQTTAFTFDLPMRKYNMGAGLNISNDKTHIINRFEGQATYAYHLPFSTIVRHGFSIGIGAGVISQRLDFNGVPIEDINDALLFENAVTGTGFNASAGVRYYLKGLDISVAIPQLMTTGIKYPNATGGKTDFSLNQHLVAGAAYRFDVSSNLILRPGINVRHVKNAPLQTDITLQGVMAKTLQLGVAFRSANTQGHSLNFTGGIQLRNFSIWYNYDMMLNGASRTSLGNTHEIMVGYHFARKGVKSNEELQDDIRDINDQLDQNKAMIDSIGQRTDEKLARNQVEQAQLQHAMDTLANKVNNFNPDSINNPSDSIRTDSIYRATNLNYRKLGTIYFAKGSATLDFTGNANLNILADEAYKNHRIITLYLQGNASAEGSTESNLSLSTKRAIAVRDYLVKKGLNPEQLIVLPYGEDNPATTSQLSENDKAKNRRVDIFILAE